MSNRINPRDHFIMMQFGQFHFFPESVEKLYKLKLIVEEEYEFRKEWADNVMIRGENGSLGLSVGNQEKVTKDLLTILDYLGNIFLNNQEGDSGNAKIHLLLQKYPKFVNFINLIYYG